MAKQSGTKTYLVFQASREGHGQVAITMRCFEAASRLDVLCVSSASKVGASAASMLGLLVRVRGKR